MCIRDRARADELSTAECMDAAEQLADLGCRRVSLIGGEVFLRRDWAQIAGRLTGLGVRVDVIKMCIRDRGRGLQNRARRRQQLSVQAYQAQPHGDPHGDHACLLYTSRCV